MYVILGSVFTHKYIHKPQCPSAIIRLTDNIKCGLTSDLVISKYKHSWKLSPHSFTMLHWSWEVATSNTLLLCVDPTAIYHILHIFKLKTQFYYTGVPVGQIGVNRFASIYLCLQTDIHHLCLPNMGLSVLNLTCDYQRIYIEVGP